MATATKRQPKPAPMPRWQKKAIQQKERERRADQRAKRKAHRAAFWNVVSGVVGAVWIGKRPLGMFYLAALAYLAGFAAVRWPLKSSGVIVLCGAAIVIALLVAARGQGRSTFRYCWLAGMVTACVGWLVAATMVGMAAPMPGVLLSLALVASVAWWVHLYRPQPEPAKPEPVQIDPRIEVWARALRRQFPKGTRFGPFEDVLRDDDGDGEPDMMGFAGVVQIPVESGKTAEVVYQRAANFAAAYDVPLSCVVVEPTTDQTPSRARVTVLNRRNPLHEINEYDRTWIVLKDGCYPEGLFPDGTRSWHRLYEPRSGPVHALISGDTRSGKSRTANLIITQDVMTGLVVPFVADPQGGQSLPAWAGPNGRAAWIAFDEDEIWRQMLGLERLMLSRNRRLTQHEWTDEDGIARKGLDFFDPLVTPDLPIIDWALDEGHVMIQDKEFGDRYERNVKLASKTGVRFILMTQNPAASPDLGGRMGLRNQLAGGDVICHRISNKTINGMILPSGMPSPFDIPQVTPEGKHTKGTNITHCPAPQGMRRSYRRSARIANEHKWADIAVDTRQPGLPTADIDALGDDFQTWRDRHRRFLAGGVVIDLHPRQTQLPAPVAVPVQAPRTRESIVDYLTRRDTAATTGVISAALDVSRSTVSKHCKKLAAAGQIVDAGYGQWRSLEKEAVPA